MDEPRSENALPSETPHCAGRLAVAHPRTPMVDGLCPVCGEHQYARCQTVIGTQHGEPVLCGAAEAIHGDALGMVAGHEFDAAPLTLRCRCCGVPLGPGTMRPSANPCLACSIEASGGSDV